MDLDQIEIEDQAAEDSGYEEFIPDEEPDQEDQMEDFGSSEEEESVPEESEGETEAAAEDDKEEPEEMTGETISGNDIVTVSGNAVIFPEGFDFSLFQVSFGDDSENLVVDVLENQTNVIFGVSVVVIFLLGVIAGILLVHGFRLRRV